MMSERKMFPAPGTFKGPANASRVRAGLEIWPFPILSLNNGLLLAIFWGNRL
jgi:hypothetical protein